MLTVAFTFEGDLCVDLARLMVASVRGHMPSALIVQLTDEATPMLPFADEVRRLPDPADKFAFHCRHLAALPGEAIYLDYDCIVQRDLSRAFDFAFDMALTRRPKNDKTASKAVQDMIPHNIGVSFQRNGKFWKAAGDRYATLINKDGWMTGQMVVTDTVEREGGRLRILELPGEYWNYTPDAEDEDVRARAVVHYKGKRKAWMLRGASSEAIAQATRDAERVASYIGRVIGA